MRTWAKLILFIIFVVISVLNVEKIDSVSHSASDTIRPFMIQTAGFILLFMIIYFGVIKAKSILSKK